ncbi:Imm40 family immunity protein, partial [Kistimonas asteriae]|uniref:Imm40 family immunity protein n=1 Tax=Kistimonas asteriae TaxID=517724 RepID=UPI001BAE2188
LMQVHSFGVVQNIQLVKQPSGKALNKKFQRTLAPLVQLNLALTAMKYIDIPSQLLEKAISLEHIGSNEVAWFKSDIPELLNRLESVGAFVLGGDVLSFDCGEYRHNYDNWYFELSDGSAKQSIEHTRNYINKYPAGNYAFVVVVA